MKFNSRKKTKEKLLESFGKEKDDSFYFDFIKLYFTNKDNSETFQTISDKACNDLDFEELFMFADRTTSKVGQQYLYNRLRNIPHDLKNRNGNEKLIKKLTDDSELRVNIQKHLSRLNDTDTYRITYLFQGEHVKPPKWFFVVRILSFTSLFSLVMLPFNPQMLFVLVAVLIANIGFHFWNKKNVYQYTGTIPQLLRLKNVAKKLFQNKELKNINPELNKSIKLIDKVRNRMLFFKMEASVDGEFNVVAWTVLELFKITFLLEPLLFFSVIKKLDTKRKEVEDVFRFVGEVDTLISIASLRKGLDNYCLPEISDNQKSIIAKEVYHPLIPECVKNDITVDQKSILLTGSNMSGKTTFIRTIGINAITALTINTCFADYFSLPRLRIMSAIRISDDLMNDKSYYFEEVLTIKEMLENSERNYANLFLLDEIFKGTNTVERISAGKAVLSALQKNGNIVFVSTHDIELAELLKDEYQLYHFSEIVDDKTVDFDYKLKEGRLKNRNAIRILQINNYPDEVINEAIELSQELDRASFVKS